MSSFHVELFDLNHCNFITTSQALTFTKHMGNFHNEYRIKLKRETGIKSCYNDIMKETAFLKLIFSCKLSNDIFRKVSPLHLLQQFIALLLCHFLIVFAVGTSLPTSSSSNSNSSRSNSSSRLANSRASTRANSSHSSRVMHRGGPG